MIIIVILWPPGALAPARYPGDRVLHVALRVSLVRYSSPQASRAREASCRSITTFWFLVEHSFYPPPPPPTPPHRSRLSSSCSSDSVSARPSSLFVNTCVFMLLLLARFHATLTDMHLHPSHPLTRTMAAQTKFPLLRTCTAHHILRTTCHVLHTLHLHNLHYAYHVRYAHYLR